MIFERENSGNAEAISRKSKSRFECQFSIPETARSGVPQIHLVITMLTRTDLVDAQFLQQNQPLRVYVIIDIFIIISLL